MQSQITQTKSMRVPPTAIMANIQHFKETTHALDFDNCFILAKENHSYRRKLIEGMCIERRKDKLVNVNAGSQPNICWKPLLALLPELDLEYHLWKISDQHQQNPNNF